MVWQMTTLGGLVVIRRLDHRRRRRLLVVRVLVVVAVVRRPLPHGDRGQVGCEVPGWNRAERERERGRERMIRVKNGALSDTALSYFLAKISHNCLESNKTIEHIRLLLIAVDIS